MDPITAPTTTTKTQPIGQIASWAALLHRRAEEAPEAMAYRFLPEGEGPGVAWSRVELARRAQAFAERMSGGPSAARALLLFPPGLDYVAAVLGCLIAGAVAVPAYPPQRPRSLPRLQAIAADCRPRWIVGPAAVLERIRAGSENWGAPEWVAAETVDDPAEIGGIGRTSPAPGNLALIQYTSGSTGDPKGVLLTHANLLSNSDLIHRRFEMHCRREVVSWLPPYHDMGLIGGILQPLFAGVPATLLPPSPSSRVPCAGCAPCPDAPAWSAADRISLSISACAASRRSGIQGSTSRAGKWPSAAPNRCAPPLSPASRRPSVRRASGALPSTPATAWPKPR